MASTRKIFLNSLSSKGSVSTGARISLLWTLIAQKCQLFWRVSDAQANTNPHIGLEREPLVSVYY